MFQNVAYRPTVYKTGIFPNVNDALKDKDIFPMDIETMDLLLNVAVVGSQLFGEHFNPNKKNFNSKFRKVLAKKYGIFQTRSHHFFSAEMGRKYLCTAHLGNINDTQF